MQKIKSLIGRMICKLKQFLTLLPRMYTQTKIYFQNKKIFGSKVARYIWRDRVFCGWRKTKYISVIQQYVDDFLKDLIKEYCERPMCLPEKPSVNRVWCSWWQGESNMPKMVQLCVDSIKKSLPPEVEFCLITQDNVGEYVQLPEMVSQKFYEHKIGNAHYSDVLRFALLRKYGGFWIDATIFVSQPIPETYFQMAYYTQRFASEKEWSNEASQGKWATFLLCGVKENLLFHFVYDALVKWWSTYDVAIDYVLLDYIMMSAYRNIPSIRNITDSVPANNEDVWTLLHWFNKPFSRETFSKLCDSQPFHKLSYRLKFREERNGTETYYSHFMNHLKP